MKRIILTALCLILIALACASCSKPVPELRLEYTVEDEAQIITVKAYSYNWRSGLNGVSAAVAHPLDSIGNVPLIDKNGGPDELKLSFSRAPDSFSVVCWPDEYLGHGYYPDGEPVGVSDGILVLSADGMGYIYQVTAKWPQGSVSYVFYVK
ncbi:MAG: hypothetical protein FWE85_00940 [Clostridiales bacterium]|nr:hypothetical protein [Clostridiales bacterium]